MSMKEAVGEPWKKRVCSPLLKVLTLCSTGCVRQQRET
jgi:hypothetical protein